MNYEEYRTGGNLKYAAFVGAIRQILKAAVAAHNIVPHAITGRAKAPDSLAKKLDERGIDRASPIDEALKDLAGARLVFLTNGQVDAFSRAGILADNFEILNVNVHHPVPGTETETRLFDSTNYLVQLKPERLALPEYRPFEGMRAEIQVQTLLNHAWAEMGHDTIYKQPRLEHVGEKRLAAIKERMDRVMREYLLPAGHDFDKIARDFNRLLAADEGVPEARETLRTSVENNALSEAIGKLDDLILPHFDEPCPEFLALLPSLVDAVERTRGSTADTIDTPFGSYPGKSGENIALKISKLIGDFRYCDPEQTFSALLRLYSGADTDTERKVWIDLADQFSKHNLDIWKRYGAALPHQILKGIAALGPTETVNCRGLLVTMLGNILSPEIVGMTATSTTITTQEATIAATEEVTRMRGEAIGLLEQLLDLAPDDEARRSIVEAMRKAARPPFNGGTADLIAMVIADSARVTAIENARAAQWGLELRRRTEASLLRRYHRFHLLAPHVAEKEHAVAAHAALIGEIGKLRATLNANEDFIRYKTLVGHDSVRPDAWDGDRFDPEAMRRWRTESYPAIVATITDETIADWIARLRLYLAEPRSGDDHLWPLAECTKLFGETKPALASTLLYEMDAALAPLLLSLLLGIDRGGGRESLRLHVARWIGEGRFLSTLGDYLRSQDPFELDMLEGLSARAIELADDAGVLACLHAAVRRFEAAAERRLIDNIFMPAVDYLTAAKRSDWIDRSWGFTNGALLSALDGAQVQRTLDSIVGVPEISYQADMLLALVAERFPELVLEFFESRIQYDRGADGLRFDPIPFSLDLLKGPLAAHPGLLVAATRRWYQLAPIFHEFRGGRLLHHIFPELAQIAAPLGAMIDSGDRDDIAFILATLKAYDGAPEIYPLCIDIVEALDEGDALLPQIVHALGEKGVLIGEFGYVEAEAEQRRRLEQFQHDPRPKVQAFVREQQRQIAQSMAWEQRRAVREVEQRKRDWGEA